MKCIQFISVAILLLILTSPLNGQSHSGEKLYQEALYHMEGTGDYNEAIIVLNRITKEYTDNEPLASKALFKLGVALEKLDKGDAAKVYQRILNEYSNQREMVYRANTQLMNLEVHSAGTIPTLDENINGGIVVLQLLTLNEDTNPKEFEHFVVNNFVPTFIHEVPGVRAYIIKGTRGERDGKYALMTLFDSRQTRDLYYASFKGEENRNESISELWLPGQEMFDRLQDYVVDVGVSKELILDNYFAINIGNTISFREFRLNDGVTPEELESFIQHELVPTFNLQVPGMRAVVLTYLIKKPTDEYVFILIKDSEKTRDFYFPIPKGDVGEGLASELFNPGHQQFLRFLQYANGLSKNEGYTDYLILGLGVRRANDNTYLN